MTQQLHTVSSELNRITNYTSVMAKLANHGLKTELDTAQLQAIFADIANVTGWAYSEMQSIINNDCPFDNPYMDKYDKSSMPPQTGR